MQYLNVSLSGLRGRNHPCISNIITTSEVKKLRPYLKLLTGDYLTYERRYNESNQGSPICKICHLENESVSHIVATCSAYEVIRTKIIQELGQLCLLSKSPIIFEDLKKDPNKLTQFILDPTSFNLETRINISDPTITEIFRLSRDLCQSIHTERIQILKQLSEKQS